MKNSLIKALQKDPKTTVFSNLTKSQAAYLKQKGFSTGNEYAHNIKECTRFSLDDVQFPVKTFQLYLINDLTDFANNAPLTHKQVAKLLRKGFVLG